MKNFRVAKCLVDGEVNEFAIFEDGNKKLIFKDKEGHKYFLVDNELNDSIGPFKKKFYNRIQDAITTIRNGDGDCLKSDNLFGSVISVVYFLDRDFGEKMRNKSIEGWKDTEFGWAIEVGSKNSFSGYGKLTKDGDPISSFDNPYRYHVFNTEAEATEYIEQLVIKSKNYAQELINKNKGKSSEEIEKNTNETIDNIFKTDGMFSIVCEFTFDFLNEEGTDFKNSEKTLTDYGYRIVQCVKPKKELIKKTQYELDSVIHSVGLSNKYSTQIEESKIVNFFRFMDENSTKYNSVDNLINEGLQNNGLMINQEDGLRLFETWKKSLV